MPATIKIKNSSTASAVPTSSDLVQGELAVNVTDKRIFTENASGTVVELGINPSSITTSTIVASSTIKGGATISVGNATPSASGAGITFPATQSASSDANTLDDYEEGTWTPTVVGTGTAGTCTYTTRVGKYTKIGNVVTLMCSLGWSGHTGTGNTLISTLPFTPANYSSNAVWPAAVYASNMNFGTSATALAAFAVEADTTILFRGMINNATRADVPLDSAVDNLVVNVTYYI